jgi:TonB family protein
MKVELRLIVMTLLWLHVPVLAQSTSPPSGQDKGLQDQSVGQPQNASGYEILTEKPNEKVQPYADGVLQAVREKWYPLVTEPRESSNKDRGTTIVEFVINKDGSFHRIKIAESSGNSSLDTAALNAIESVGPYAPLPPELQLKSLGLRFHFIYRQATADRPACDRLGSGVYRVDTQVKVPRALSDPQPGYTEEARIARYQGALTLRVTLGTDGLASDVCVVDTLGYGFDEEAVSYVKTWKFEPVTENGLPVPAAMNVEMTFHLY